MNSANAPSRNGQNDAALLLAVAWTECSISSIFVTFRFYCRKKITKNLWWDDWFIMITFIFAIISASMFTGYALNGGTKHIFDDGPAQISKVTAFNYVSQGCCMLALSTGKVSVALLIYRLQAPCRWRTWLLALLSGSSFVLAILIIALFLAQCSSVKALWSPGTGSCWDPKVVNDVLIGAFSYWALVDFLLALLPLTFLWKLQMSTKRKALLSTLLGLGIFASVCAAFKAYYLSTLIGKADSTWLTVPLLIWNSNEVNAIIYAACIPTVVPIFTHSYQRISSWAASKTRRDHKTDTSDDAKRLPGTDGTNSPSKPISFSNPLGDCLTESEGHGGKGHLLELDFTGHSAEV